VAANEPLWLDQEQIQIKGHALECRINAEDPYENFRPSPGLITAFVPPPLGRENGVSVRLDSHVQPGYRIPVYYDSMIGKLIVAGESRGAAIAGMRAALGQFQVEGIKTTIAVHQQILQHPDFVAGHYDTGLIGRMNLGGR
jgi:acetyl-CoA carboxylase biotin carboxylase subunit